MSVVGFIDESKLKRCRIKVLDGDGNIVPELSKMHMMENCHDFVNEMSELECVCQQKAPGQLSQQNIMLNMRVRV